MALGEGGERERGGERGREGEEVHVCVCGAWLEGAGHRSNEGRKIQLIQR